MVAASCDPAWASQTEIGNKNDTLEEAGLPVMALRLPSTAVQNHFVVLGLTSPRNDAANPSAAPAPSNANLRLNQSSTDETVNFFSPMILTDRLGRCTIPATQ